MEWVRKRHEIELFQAKSPLLVAIRYS